MPGSRPMLDRGKLNCKGLAVGKMGMATHRQRDSAQGVGYRLPRLIAVACLTISLGLALGARSKCDVPAWLPPAPGQSPHSCHDTPSPS
jgi:hypothetical protein